MLPTNSTFHGRVRVRGRVVAGLLASSASLAVTFSEACCRGVRASLVVVQMQAAGVATPMATVHPSWSVKKPGCLADLSINGVVATGTSTRLTAEWTSGRATSPAFGLNVLVVSAKHGDQDAAEDVGWHCGRFRGFPAGRLRHSRHQPARTLISTAALGSASCLPRVEAPA